MSEGEDKEVSHEHGRDEGRRADLLQGVGQRAAELPMPVLVLTGENASGPFVVEQARFYATNVSGVAVRDAGHWLMEEATDQVVPA
jgi:pimeloyl-ACP methyl ester carboxylesterase